MCDPWRRKRPYNNHITMVCGQYCRLYASVTVLLKLKSSRLSLIILSGTSPIMHNGYAPFWGTTNLSRCTCTAVQISGHYRPRSGDGIMYSYIRTCMYVVYMYVFNTITFETIDVDNSFLVCEYILRENGWGSYMVIGSRSRSRSQEQNSSKIPIPAM